MMAVDWTAVGIAIGGLASGLAGALTWVRRERRQGSRDAADMAEDQARVSMLHKLADERDAIDDELTRERVARGDSDRRALMAEATLTIARHELEVAAKDMARLKRRLRTAGVPDSEIMPLIESDFGSLDELQ